MINLKQWHYIFEAIESVVDKYCDDMEESCDTQVSPMMENIQWNGSLECLVIPTWESYDKGGVEPGWITVGEEEVEDMMIEMGNDKGASE